MFYITGDRHRHFLGLFHYCEKNKLTADDTIIILGDAGINYYGQSIDKQLKRSLSSQKITFFCIHGNHEQRPETIDTYKEKIAFEAPVYFEEEYPNVLFAKDGEIYNLGGYQTLVIGGAYSIDKYARIKRGEPWWEDEQPSDKLKIRLLNRLITEKPKIDIVLSHTCPYRYIPLEGLIDGIDQTIIDQSTEHFLDTLETQIDYKKWYCGHFHIDKEVDNIEFLYSKIKKLGTR